MNIISRLNSSRTTCWFPWENKLLLFCLSFYQGAWGRLTPMPLTKHEDLNLIPRVPVKTLDVVACAYNPSTGRLRWV